MSLSAFVLMVLGILTELIVLFEAANGEKTTESTFPLVSSFPLTRVLAPGLAVLAAILVAVFEWTGIGSRYTTLDDSFASFIFVVVGVFVFFSAMAANLFLPIVNEQTILLVQVQVLFGAFLGGEAVDWLPLGLLTVIPLVASLVIMFWRTTFPATAKAVLVLWYLATLMVIPFQSGQIRLFKQPHLGWLDAYILGGLLVFMVIHGLFTVRFFLIASSLLVPRNRVRVNQVMPRLFSDEQVSPMFFIAVGLLGAALLFFNRQVGLVSQPAALGLSVMLSVQLLSIWNKKRPVAPPWTWGPASWKW